MFNQNKSQLQRSDKKKSKPVYNPNNSNKWIDAIIMVPRTKGRELCKALRETENSLRKVSSSAVKILEDPGTQLQYKLGSNNWRKPCPREHCIPCKAGDGKWGTCTQRSIVYQSTCLQCKK